jgi:anti-sigma regulatory factor (Ser/Thr protein kinase)
MSRADSPTFSQVIPSQLAEVETLCGQIRALLQKKDLCPVCFAVELLMRESLNNAILHGNESDPAKLVTLRLWVGREWIRLQVCDQGTGFNWHKARPRGLDLTSTSGRGLHLYTLYADRVRFNRRGNQITLWISKKEQAGKEN